MNSETKVTEMDDSYAGGGYQSMSVELPPAPITMPGADPADDSVVIGTPDSGMLDPANVSVFASSINPVSYMTDSTVVAFDVVFSVSCICPDGRSEMYQVVKRIGVDKMKLANDAKSSTPVSIVEAKAPAAPVEPEKFLISKERMRAIAGLK